MIRKSTVENRSARRCSERPVEGVQSTGPSSCVRRGLDDARSTRESDATSRRRRSGRVRVRCFFRKRAYSSRRRTGPGARRRPSGPLGARGSPGGTGRSSSWRSFEVGADQDVRGPSVSIDRMTFSASESRSLVRDREEVRQLVLRFERRRDVDRDETSAPIARTTSTGGSGRPASVRSFRPASTG